MEKVLVALHIPVLEKCYDIWLPDFLPVGALVQQIIRAVEELTSGLYIPSGTEALCLMDAEVVMERERTLAQYGVRMGERIAVI